MFLRFLSLRAGERAGVRRPFLSAFLLRIRWGEGGFKPDEVSVFQTFTSSRSTSRCCPDDPSPSPSPSRSAWPRHPPLSCISTTRWVGPNVAAPLSTGMCWCGFRLRPVRQFHHIIKVAAGVIPADVKECQLTWMLAGDLFKLLDACELAPVWTVILKRTPPDNFRGAQRTGGLVARQPDVAISAMADAPEQFVIGNRRLGLSVEDSAACDADGCPPSGTGLPASSPLPVVLFRSI